MGRSVKLVLATLAGLGLAACFALGTGLAVMVLPGFKEAPPPSDSRSYEAREEMNWLGQGRAVVCTFALLLWVAIYAGKRLISQGTSSVPAAVGWFGLAVAASLPYIWFLLVTDWQNPFIYRFSCWVHDPIAVWAIPTVSFAWDVLKRPPPTGRAYVVRSLVELAVLPAWIVLWAYFSFFCLGGGWI